jgi:hypothetical protein
VSSTTPPKLCLACHANGTQTARDAVTVLEAAIAEAERLLERPLAVECLDEETGELHPLVIVSDKGPAYKSDPLPDLHRQPSRAQPRPHQAPRPRD